MRKTIVNLLLVTIATIIALIMAEGLLRLTQPFDHRIRGHEITLRTNMVYELPNVLNDKLPERLIHSRNNIGFRGPDWTEDTKHALRIFTVGGSTTECFYLSDGYDWTAVMANILYKNSDREMPLFVNNAGLDGHSTFGHRILLRDILLDYEPHLILYLVGANDVGRRDLTDHAQTGLTQRTYRSGNRIKNHLQRGIHLLAQHSELAALTENLIRGWRARNLGVTHQSVDFRALPLRDTLPEELEHMIQLNNDGYIQNYRNRLTLLMKETIAAGIQPILITQPVPYGHGMDPETGVDLSRIEVRNGSGYLRWREVELYNDVTREVAEQLDIYLIDLERELPKNTRFYYDLIHFTVEGAEAVGQIVANHVDKIAP